MVCGNVVLPFENRIPTDTQLYRMMTTKPGEVEAEGREGKWMMGWLIGGGVLCMIVLMTALCVVSGDADEQAEAAYRHFLESRGRKA